jgi:hypothetical protein
VGSALAAFAHLNGLQSGYVPPILPDDNAAAPAQPPYSALGNAQPAFQPHPSQNYPGQPHMARHHVASLGPQAYPQPAPPTYPAQPYGYVGQPPAAEQPLYGSPYSAQPQMAQSYPGQPAPGQHVPGPSAHGQPPAYAQPVYQPHQEPPSAPAPGYGHMPPYAAVQPYGQPLPQYAEPTQSLQMQPYGHQPHAGYATQPSYPAHVPQPHPAPYPMAQPHAQVTARIAPRPAFTPGYSEHPQRALLRSADDLGEKKSWHVSDDAPRYVPPGTSEADLDPFGLAALPEQEAYHGSKEVPSEAVYGLLFGLCSLLLFPLAFLGFVRARRAGSMIDAAPSRFRGRSVVLLGFALNVACPTLSVATGAYLFGFI